MSFSAWDFLVQPFAERHTLVRCDFRGQLLSPGELHTSMHAHADDVIKLLDALSIDRAHLVGASFGAEVAMLAAARSPDRVMSLVAATATESLTERMLEESRQLRQAALDAADNGDRAQVFQLLAPNTFSEGWLARQPAGFIELRAAQIGMLPRSFFAGVAGLMRALDTLDLRKELPRITAPTLVIGAELDRVFPLDHSRAIAQAIPGARLEVIEAAGHAAVVEKPDEFVRLVTGFIDEVDSMATSIDAGPDA